MISFQIRRSYLIAGLCGAGLLIAWGFRILANSRKHSNEVDSCISELRAEVRSIQHGRSQGGGGGGMPTNAHGFHGGENYDGFRGGHNSLHNPESSVSVTSRHAGGGGGRQSYAQRSQPYASGGFQSHVRAEHHLTPPSHGNAASVGASSNAVSTATQTYTPAGVSAGHHRNSSYEILSEIVSSFLTPISNILY